MAVQPLCAAAEPEQLLLRRHAEQALESAPELVVEDGVDGRVEKAVDVAEPDEKGEENRVEATDGRHVEQVVANARRVDDVQREKRHPAEQKHTCNDIVVSYLHLSAVQTWAAPGYLS